MQPWTQLSTHVCESIASLRLKESNVTQEITWFALSITDPALFSEYLVCDLCEE